jgi:hypothetical protein
MCNREVKFGAFWKWAKENGGDYIATGHYSVTDGTHLQVSADTKALSEAQKELLLWRDPAYIKSQARERLHFVLPGERQYIVTDSTSQGEQNQSTLVATHVPDNQPWYTRLVASITETGSK